MNNVEKSQIFSSFSLIFVKCKSSIKYKNFIAYLKAKIFKSGRAMPRYTKTLMKKVSSFVHLHQRE